MRRQSEDQAKLPDEITLEALGAAVPHAVVKAVVAELEKAADLGLVGGKFHPSIQAFDPSDERHWPVFAKCDELGFPCIFHTGTSGIGGGTPGGQGIRIDLCRPILLDPLAAAFPKLTIIAAHMGWPWHVELLAMALWFSASAVTPGMSWMSR